MILAQTSISWWLKCFDSHSSVGILLQGKTHFLPHLSIYVSMCLCIFIFHLLSPVYQCQYIFMNSYCNQGVTIYCSPYLFWCQWKLLQAGTCLFWHSPRILLSNSLLLDTVRYSGLIFYFHCSDPGISLFSKDPVFFWQGIILRIKNLGAKCAPCYWGVSVMRHFL